MVYGIGIIVIVFTFVYLIFLNIDSGGIDLLGIVNGLLFIIIGIGLIAINRSILNAVKEVSSQDLSSAGAVPVSENVEVDVYTSASSGQQIPAMNQTRQGRRSAHQTPDDDIQVSIRLPITQQQTKRAQAPPQTKRKEIKVSCPKCNGIIRIDANQRSGSIKCTHCGYIGTIG